MNLTSGDLGIPLVVIRPGVTRLKKTRVVCLSDLFEGRGEKGQCELVCVERLSNIGLMVVMLMCYWNVCWVWFQFCGELVLFLGIGMEIRDKKCVALLHGSEKSAGWHPRHLMLAIGCYRTVALTIYPWPNG